MVDDEERVPSGCLRLWLVLSVVWVLGVVVDLCAVALHISSHAPDPFANLASDDHSWLIESLSMGALIFGPPVALYIAAFVFSRASDNEQRDG